MKKVFAFLLLASTFAIAQQDINISAVNPFVTLGRSLAWGVSGPGGVNNNFIFQPPTADSTICVAITNNNPSSVHSVQFNVFQTIDPQVKTFQTNQLRWAPVPINGVTFPQVIPSLTTLTFYYRSTAAARLALVISASSVQPGSPDTADLVVGQPSANSFCGSAAGTTAVTAVIGPTGQGGAIAAANQAPVLVGGWQESGGTIFNIAQHAAVDANSNGWIMGVNNAVSEGSQVGVGSGLNNVVGTGAATLFQAQMVGQSTDGGIGTGAGSQPGIARISRYGLVTSDAFAWTSDNLSNVATAFLAYNAQKDQVNPAAGLLLLAVVEGATSTMRPHKAYISCSAACDVFINRVSTAGATCTAVTIVKAFDPSLGNASGSTANTGACVTNPTVTYTIVHLWLGAATSQTFDLSGYYTKPAAGAGNGFDITEGAAVAAGTVSVTLDWMER